VKSSKRADRNRRLQNKRIYLLMELELPDEKADEVRGPAEHELGFFGVIKGERDP
jgi:hypothetical protein